MFIVSALSNMGHEIGILQSKNSTISEAVCAGALSCWKV